MVEKKKEIVLFSVILLVSWLIPWCILVSYLSGGSLAQVVENFLKSTAVVFVSVALLRLLLGIELSKNRLFLAIGIVFIHTIVPVFFVSSPRFDLEEAFGNIITFGFISGIPASLGMVVWAYTCFGSSDTNS